MAKTKTLGSAIVRFLSQGLDKLKAEIGIVQSSVTGLANENERAQRKIAAAARRSAREAAETRRWWDDLGASFDSVGRRATAALAIGTAAAAGFVRLADPRGVDLLTIAIGRLSIQIGRIFVPVVREVTEWFNRATEFMRGLSDATRESILQWSLFGARVLATVAVFGVVSRFIFPLIGQFLTLGNTISRLATSLGGLGAIGFAAAFIAAGTAVAAFTGRLGSLQDIAGSIWSAVAPVLESLRSAFMALAEALAPVFDSLLSLATSALPIIAGAFQVVGNVVAFFVNILASLIDTLGVFGTTAIATFLILLRYPGIVSGIIGIFGSLIGVVRNVITGVQSLSGAMTALFSNPWTLVIAGIAVAVGALVSSFSAAAGATDRLATRLAHLDSIRERLRSGAPLRHEDLTGLDEATAEAIRRARTPEERRAIAERRLAEERTRLAGEGAPAAVESREARIRRVLEGARTVDVGSDILGEFASTARPRARAEERARLLREAGVDERDIARLLPHLATGGISEAPLDVDRVLRERGPRAFRDATDTRIRILDRLARGESPGDDRFRGEARVPAAQFTSILDFARKVQTATSEDPATVIAREGLAESRVHSELLRRISTDTSRIATAPRGVVPGA